MTQDEPIKKYPVSTSEVAKMLGIDGASKDLPMSSFSSHASHSDLPVVHNNVAVAHTTNIFEAPHAKDTSHSTLPNDHKPEATPQNSTTPKIVKIARAGAPYVAVFVVGLFLYYFFFTGVNFGALFQSAPKPVTPSQTALQQLEAADSVSYQQWIKGFYYDVTDSKILDPESDNSGNGLTNFQKYLLNLNPKSYDTLGLGQPDSQTLAMNIDPSSGQPLTDKQKATVSKYIDMEVVMNRLTLNKLQHPEQVAGAGINSNGVIVNNQVLPNIYQNNQIQQNGQNNKINVSPTTGADLLGSGILINTDIPGRLEIPDLKINVPLIWTKDTNNFEKDLQTGVVHYPGTAMPGDIGTTYISGHSSNYVWAKGDFNHVFTHLGDLADNTSFKITVVQTNGKNAIFHYVVTHRAEYLPSDQAQFANTGKSIVALSTCWPVNSTAKRLVVFGVLTQTEQ